MSSRVAQLSDKCLRVSHDPTSDEFAINLVPECFEWLRDAGHPIEGVAHVYNAVSLKEDGNTGYVVCEVETLEYPLDMADAAADKTSLWVCSCPGFHYHRFPDLSKNERPSDAGTCKHIDRVKRKERVAIEDENQGTLEVME